MAVPYATIDDLRSLGLRGRALEGVDPADIEAQLLNASGFIDTFLPSHYKAPLVAPFHPSIVEATVAITSYRLLGWRGWRPGPHDEEIRARYRDAMQWLEMLSKGSVSLPSGSDGTTRNEGAPQVQTGGVSRTAASPDYAAGTRRNW